MIQQARGPTACARVHERWAHLRFSVIGQLLAAPPAKGELKAAITALAARAWQHPTIGDPVQFGFNVQAGTKRCSRPNQKITQKRRTECSQIRYPDPKTSPLHETGASPPCPVR
jgi:hypothetical protein